jgi:hypothetical protein
MRGSELQKYLIRASVFGIGTALDQPASASLVEQAGEG